MHNSAISMLQNDVSIVIINMSIVYVCIRSICYYENNN